MKNIWFINEYDLPPEFSKFRRRYDMSKYLLKKKKYNIHILCGSFIHGTENQYAYKEKYQKNIEYQGVHVHILKGVAYNSILKRVISMTLFGLKVAFFKFSKEERPDVIFSSSPHLFAALGAFILAKRNKAKFILEVRDLWPETWVQMGIIKQKGIIHRFFLLIEKFLYIHANKIIFLGSRFDYFLNLGISKDKLEYISNGVDLEEFDKKTSLMIPLNKNKFNITYTGAMGKANNLDIILDLAKLVQKEKIQFHLIGYGPFKSFLEKRVLEENINNILFHNPINKNMVPEVLRNSDALIMAVLDIDLYKNGVSFNKLFEYWAASKPILFYGRITPDYIHETQSGMVGKNIEDFKEGCIKLYNMSESERKMLGDNGRRYVEENFSWEKLADKVDVILNEVLK
ncbi:hypothetical protein IX293_001729 [Fusobacterium necrophorum]|nr:glycosyltransferase family 4 protein [Fusobacterium necrophorum]MBR8823459.1 hypothetical protein [Fusobacterium necrophorum]